MYKLAALFIAVAAVFLSFCGGASAQVATATVVPSCGSASYSAGVSLPWTMDETGKLCTSGSGGGGTPGGTNGQIQFNNSGSFGGLTPAIATGCGASGGTIGNSLSGTIATAESTDAQTGAGYTIAATDCGKLVTLSNAGAQTLTLNNLSANQFFDVLNIGAGTWTIGAGTGSIIGGPTSLTQNQGARVVFDGTNWHVQAGAGSGGGSGNTTISPATGNTANNIVTMSNTTTTIKDSGTALASLAPLASPTFTGTVTLPGSGTFTSSLATLAQPGLLTSSVAPTIAAGQLGIGGLFGTPATLGANGEGQIYVSTVNGAVVQGQGSGASVTLMGAGGSSNCSMTSGGTLTCMGQVRAGTNIAALAGTITADISSNNAQLSYMRNSSAGAAAVTQFAVGNNTSQTEFSMSVNSSANTGGNGANSSTINGAGGLWFQGGGTNALTISSSQAVALPAIASDATHTDATVCEDTTTHTLFSGSGTSGVCLGTSSIRFKRDVKPLDVGLNEIMALSPKKFYFKNGWGDNGAKEHYGLIAEDAIKIDGHLVGLDKAGKPNSVDLVALIPVLVNAIQKQQAEIERLKKEIK